MKTLLFILISFTTLIFPQELNCTVTLSTGNISISARDKLQDFAQKVQDYMNKTQFTNDPAYQNGAKIDCSMNIFVLSAANDINYTAQVVVTSLRPIYKSQDNSLVLSINDNTWSFSYDPGQAFYRNQSVFDPITGFLDYYAYIIIGFDLDTWNKLGGTPYFSKASDIASLGAVSAFSSGWNKNSNSYSRRGLVDDLLNDKFRPFRESIYDYYYGIDIYSMNKAEGQKHIVKLVGVLQDLRAKMDLNTVLIKVFFDAKAGEIVDKLKTYPDKEKIFTALKKIDPAHAGKYDEQLAN
ncbi:MAG: DUF4835 family protein [Ignavibacteriaceae bacterium]